METATRYERVIPRDLFNESDLLKCWGRLAIVLEGRANHNASIEHDGGAFDIVQDESSGAISVTNLALIVAGEPRAAFRPLNSRTRYALWVSADEDDIAVLDEVGNPTDEFLAFITAPRKG